MATQHYVTGVGDTSFQALAEKYGIPAKGIIDATFGSGGASLIYPWLRDHPEVGQKEAADPTISTGFHWSYKRGAVVIIPDPIVESLSPVSYYAEPEAKPGGPLVTVFYADSPVVGDTGDPTTGREFPPEGEPDPEVPPLIDPGTGEPVPAEPPPVKVAGFMGLSWTMWLILGVAAYLLFGEPGKKKPPRKPPRKRKKPKKRGRRRNYYRRYYGGDD